MCNDVAFERSEDVCAGVGVGRFVVTGRGGRTEYHCEDEGKMSFAEGLDWMGLDSGTLASFSASPETFFGDFVLLSEDLFSFSFDFLAERRAASSFTFPSRFFFEGPECRPFKSAETSAARFGYFNSLEDGERSSRMDISARTHIVRFDGTRHEVLLIARIPNRFGFCSWFLLT